LSINQREEKGQHGVFGKMEASLFPGTVDDSPPAFLWQDGLLPMNNIYYNIKQRSNGDLRVDWVLYVDLAICRDVW